MEVYRRGTVNYNLQRYEAALADFQEASSLYASPDFQFNIGLCYENLDKPAEAVRAFQIYLRAKPNAPDRDAVQQRIDRLSKLAAEYAKEAEEQNKPTVVIAPADDGQAKRDRAAKVTQRLVISGSVLTGLGAAVALAGGIGFGIIAAQRSDDLDEIQSGDNPDRATFADADDIEQEGLAAERGQIAFAVSGGVVAVAGVVLLAIGLSRRKQQRASAFRLTPSLTRKTVGLSVGGRF